MAQFQPSLKKSIFKPRQPVARIGGSEKIPFRVAKPKTTFTKFGKRR